MDWSDKAWRQEAEAWIERGLAQAGLRAIGPVEDVRVKPWAAVLGIETDGGRVYFKANTPSLAHEARVTEILCRRRPDLMPEIVEADSERGWMLLRDAGVQLSAILEQDQDLRFWEQALCEYAQLQIDVAPDADELAAAFPLDRRLARIPGHFQALAESPVLRVGEPDGLTSEEAARLREHEPVVREWTAALEAAPVPESIQNDDFTHGSIFLCDGSFRFLDWGDACVSHPFFTLTVTLRVVEWVHELGVGSRQVTRVRDAYVEPWTQFAPRDELIELAEIARRLGAVCRAAYRLAAPFEQEPDAIPWAARLIVEPEAWREPA